VFFVLLAVGLKSVEAQEANIEAIIPRYGYAMRIGFGSLWIKTNDKLSRINLADNSITDIPLSGYRAPPGGWFSGIAIGADAVWLADPHAIYKIDARKGQVVKQITADLAGGGEVEFGEGAVWAITGARRNELKRYSAETGSEEAAIALPSRSVGVLAAFDSIWITGNENDELYRVDPNDNKIVATIDLGSGPGPLAAGEGSVWVYNERDGTVQRIDGATGAIAATIDTGTIGKGAIEVGGGFVWVNCRHAPIIQIDPGTNSVRSKLNVEAQEYSTIRYGGGSLWISGSTVRRVKPPG
jgi:hypothetical protein